MTASLFHFAGRAGDHNDRAMAASPILAAALSERLKLRPTVVGERTPASPADWATELAMAAPALHLMAAHYDAQLRAQKTPVAAISRCAVALATLPVVARHRPDAVVVWFDAHADLNTPDSTETGYLGGLALSGALQLWNSGLGGGLSPENTIVVGARDMEDFELRLLAETPIQLIRVGSDMAQELHRAVAGRPVYVHIDCDVLDPGIVPTDYSIAGGMSLFQLQACAQVLAASDVVGLEIGELESDGTNPSRAREDANLMASALEALMQAIENDAR